MNTLKEKVCKVFRNFVRNQMLSEVKKNLKKFKVIMENFWFIIEKIVEKV